MAVAVFLITGTVPKQEVTEGLSEAFRINRAIQTAAVDMGNSPLTDEELRELRAYRDGLHLAAFPSNPNDRNVGSNQFHPRLFDFLVGLVILVPSLAVCGHSGFNSGRPIQNS